MNPAKLVPTRKLVGDLLTGDTTFMTLLGTGGKFTGAYPDEVTAVPLVVCLEADQRTAEYVDNLPYEMATVVELHIFVANTQSTHALTARAFDVLTNEDWDCESVREVEEPFKKWRHRYMRFSRQYTSLDYSGPAQ